LFASQKEQELNLQTFPDDGLSAPFFLHSFRYLLEGYKYLGGMCNHIISNYIPKFLVIYCSVSGVMY